MPFEIQTILGGVTLSRAQILEAQGASPEVVASFAQQPEFSGQCLPGENVNDCLDRISIERLRERTAEEAAATVQDMVDRGFGAVATGAAGRIIGAPATVAGRILGNPVAIAQDPDRPFFVQDCASFWKRECC